MAINGGLVSLAPNLTADQAKKLASELNSKNKNLITDQLVNASTSTSSIIQQTASSITQQATSSAIAAASLGVTSAVTSIATGGGLTAIGTSLASSLSTSLSGTAVGSLGNIFSSLSGGLPVLGTATALSSALNNISSLAGAQSLSTNTSFSQIPPVAKGLESNGPSIPQGVSIGPAGFLNPAIDPSISSIFSQLASTLTSFNRTA